MKGVFLGLIEFIFECDPDPPVTALNAKAFYEAGGRLEITARECADILDCQRTFLVVEEFGLNGDPAVIRFGMNNERWWRCRFCRRCLHQ